MTDEKTNVIFSYGAEQAVADGVLVEVDSARFPGCVFTASVQAAIVEKIEETGERSYLEAAVPLMFDVIAIARQMFRKDPDEYLYTGGGLDGNVTGKRLWFALNEIGGITVMFPEDY